MIFYFWQLMLALDQLANVLLGGWADETLSSRAYRVSRKTSSWRWKIASTCINGLFFNRNHCYDAFESERNSTQLPHEFRTKEKK